jgi:hypothetical protein
MQCNFHPLDAEEKSNKAKAIGAGVGVAAGVAGLAGLGVAAMMWRRYIYAICIHYGR